MVWQFDENFPIYRQVVMRLKGAILRGEFGPGEKLPTVRFLAAEAGINPNTAQRALSKLEDMGLAICISTSGRRVTRDMKVIERQRKIAAEELAEYTSKAAKEIGLTPKELADMLYGQE